MALGFDGAMISRNSGEPVWGLTREMRIDSPGRAEPYGMRSSRHIARNGEGGAPAEPRPKPNLGSAGALALHAMRKNGLLPFMAGNFLGRYDRAGAHSSRQSSTSLNSSEMTRRPARFRS